MTLVNCRLTAKNRDQLRNPTLVIEYGLPLPSFFTSYQKHPAWPWAPTTGPSMSLCPPSRRHWTRGSANVRWRELALRRLLAPAAVSSAHLAAAGAVGGAAAAQRLSPSVSCIVRSSTRFLVVTDAAAAAAAGAGDVVVDSVSFIETTVLVGQLSSSSLLLSDCSRRRSSLGFVDGCARGALYLSCSRALFTCICSHPHQCSSTPLGVLCDCSRLISNRSIKACSQQMN